MLKIESSAIRLAIGVVLVNLFIYLLAGVSIYKSRQQYERQASLTTQNLANSLESTIAGFLEKMDISLFSIKNEVERQLAAGGINEKVLNAYITREKTVIPTFEEMWVADRGGNVRYGTKIIPDQPVNISDREYFQRLRKNPGSGLVISKPVIGRITKTWSMLISKRINNPDGSFAGLALGSLRFVDYFDRLFAEINVGKQGIIEFRDEELALINQYQKTAGPGGQVGSKMVSALTLDKVRTYPNSATYNAVFAQDGIERTISYKKIAGSPFYIAVSLGRSEYLSAWRNEVAVTLSLLLLFTVITAFSARMFFLRRIQAALHKEEANSRAILEISPVPMVLIDEQDTISYLNNAFTKQIGYNQVEIPTLADWRIRAYPDPHYRQMIIDKAGINLKEFRTKERFIPFEANVTCKDGIVRNFIVDVALQQRDHSNNALVSLYNITERKQAEEKLHKSEALFRAVVENSYDGIILMSAERRPLYVSPSFTRINGYLPEELIGAYGPDYVHPDDLAITTNAFLDALRSPDKVVTATYRLRHKAGHWFWVETTVTNLLHDPDIQAVVQNSREITERIKTEDELRIANKQLMQADKMVALGTLVAGVAHEINNPNNFAMLNTPLIQDVWKGVSPVLEEYYRENGDFKAGGMSYSKVREGVPTLLNGILEGTRRISGIVKELKDFAGPNDLNMNQKVDINAAVKAAVNLLQNVINKSTERFTVTYGENLPEFTGNFQRLEQVVINLIHNACQALTDRTRGIQLETFCDGHSIAVRVRDEGKGIPMEYLNQIMDPFFTTGRDSGGMGLGLSISQKITVAHGGRIDVESCEGKGSTFTIILPLVPAEKEKI
ncbi:MAG: PAS domain S-box protein [Syntrophales bacterium]